MIKIITGIIALGLVVLIHELGHFLSARLCGVEVETFSIGWGPVLFKKKIGKTEYRLSALPLGGYCGMKGEHGFTEALQQNLDYIPKEKNSFYGVHPFKRMIISFSGPLANLCFAVIVLAFVSAIGSSYESYGNRIVPASLYDGASGAPIDMAGLAEGDRIISLNGEKTKNYSDIQQYVVTHPQEKIEVEYERNGTTLSTVLIPNLDTKTGSGKVGMYPYVPLVVGTVKKESSAEKIGLKAGDVITAIDGTPVLHFLQFNALLKGKPERVTLTIDRNDTKVESILDIPYSDKGPPELGINWKTETFIIPGTGFLESIENGFIETGKTLALTIKSIGLLFRGVDLTEAVSGPVRITMMLGEIAQTSLIGVAQLLSIICVSLFLMNLLPIPILDGGQILFSLIEVIARKPLKPKTLYYVQFIGIAFIGFMFIFALFGDIRYLMK